LGSLAGGPLVGPWVPRQARGRRPGRGGRRRRERASLVRFRESIGRRAGFSDNEHQHRSRGFLVPGSPVGYSPEPAWATRKESQVNDKVSELARAACRDDEALALLVRAYHHRVHRFGLRACRDGFDADDAVQEAFSKLAERPDVARDPSALSWLLSVVRHACMRLVRPFRRERLRLGERIEDVDRVPSEALDAEGALERWQLVRAVHGAIATLDKSSREVLVLRDIEGLSGPETCVALGLTQAAMKTRLHRARAELRRELERSGQARGFGEAK